MKISTKLSIFLIGVVILFVGLATSLTRQATQLTAGYDALLAKPVRDADRARVMQVDFKKQVQEWKDTLLRGHTPADLQKYTANFHKQSEATRAGAQLLVGDIEDAQARELVSQFLVEHAKLNEKYEAAYKAYVDGNFDFKAADKMVRGQDRPPTDLCDKVVARLGAYVSESIAAQQAAAAKAHKEALTVAGSLLFLLAVIGAVIVKSILDRLVRLRAVSDRLAKADIDGLAVDISGKDEIGDFGESMKGVLAAVEELMAMSGAKS
jgi:methyl-accepting chemotaxis protein